MGAAMAVDTKGGHPAMDYHEHVRTYRGFIKLTVGIVIFLVALLLGMLIFLVP